MTDLHYLSIAEAGRRVRAGDLKSRDLIEASLARIEATNEALKSFLLVLADDVRAAADAADREIANGGWKGPLHGVPIGLKDIYSTANVRTTCHSRLLEDNVPAEDAVSVARLKDAGAIVMGKLATHEFAFGGPSFDLPWPPARNPWNPDHVTGGSSSGSGAAVAAGQCAGAMGSDTGGSIRSPAGLCGLAGLKPTYGRISRRGIYPLSWTMDHAGPLTRTAEDCAIMMQALSGYDADDPGSVDTPVPDFSKALDEPVDGLRVGVARQWFDAGNGVDDETRAALNGAEDVLRDVGCDVRDVTLPDIRDYHACGRIILLSEAYTIHRKNLLKTPEKYGEFFRDRARLGAFIAARDYVEALRMRQRLTAATMTAMADLDILLTPNQYGPAESFPDSQRSFHFFGNPSQTMPFNVTGQPALTLCAGFADSGLPIGFQLAGKPFQDDLLLRVGHAYEKGRGELGRHPPL